MNQTYHNSTHFINCSQTIRRIPIEGVYLQQIHVHFIFCLVFFTPCFFLNVFLIITILRQNRLRTLPNIPIINVLCENTISSSMISVWATNFVLAAKRHQVCNLYLISLAVGYSCSLIAVFEIWLLSVERYLAVFKPWFYEEKKSTMKKVLIWLIILTWFFSCIMGAASFIIRYFEPIKIVIAVTIPLSVLSSIAIHLRIYYFTRNITERIKRLSLQHLTESSQKHITIKAFKAQERKLTIVTASIVVQLIICYLPFCLIALYKALLKRSDSDISVLFNWSITAAAIKTFTNPVSFLYQLRRIRRSFVELVFRKKVEPCQKKWVGIQKSFNTTSIVNVFQTSEKHTLHSKISTDIWCSGLGRVSTNNTRENHKTTMLLSVKSRFQSDVSYALLISLLFICEGSSCFFILFIIGINFLLFPVVFLLSKLKGQSCKRKNYQ